MYSTSYDLDVDGCSEKKGHTIKPGLAPLARFYSMPEKRGGGCEAPVCKWMKEGKRLERGRETTFSGDKFSFRYVYIYIPFLATSTCDVNHA